jgi:recombination protein RecT
MAETSIVPVDGDGHEIGAADSPKVESPNAGMTTMAILRGAKLAELTKVCGRAATAERLIKLFAMAASRQRDIFKCSWISVMDCMTRCAELNLFPGTVGSVYLIPFRNGHNNNQYELQFILGYRGMMTLARRSGQITSIDANVVRDGDVFEFEYGIQPIFRHKPMGDQARKVTHAWALAQFKDGGHQLAVMTLGELNAIKNRSRAKNSGPWVTDEAEMQKKTVLRRLCKYLPLDAQAAELIEAQDRAEFGFDLPDVDSTEKGEAVEQKPVTAALVDRLEAARADRGVDAKPAEQAPEPVAAKNTPDGFGAEMGSLMDTTPATEPAKDEAKRTYRRTPR